MASTHNRSTGLYWLRVTCGLLILLLGISVILSWHTGWETQIRDSFQIHQRFIPMVYNTALAFALSGLALLLIKHRSIALSFGIVLMGLGSLILMEHFLGFDLLIDQLIVEDHLTSAPASPGRMAANTAICFTVAGLSFILAAVTKRIDIMAVVIAMLGFLIFIISAVAFLNYVLPIQLTFGLESLTDMAIHTATGFIILSIGIIAYGVKSYYAEGNRHFSIFSVITLVAGAIISIGLWQYLMLREDADVDRSVSITQTYLEKYIADVIKQQEIILYEITFDLSHESEMDINDKIINKVKKGYPQVDGLGTITPEGEFIWAIPLANQEAMDAVAKEIKNLPFSEKLAIKSISIPNGPKGFLMLLPYYEEGVYQGTILSAYNAENLFNSVFSQSMLDNFGVAISENGVNIYRSTNMDLTPREKQWDLTTTIQAGNSEWVLSTWPRMALIRDIYSWTPNVVFIVSLFLMITLATIIQLSINLRESHILEKKASKAKSDFLSSMSHELRTPLNAIMGYAQLIQYDTSLSREQSDNAGKIRSAGKHLLSLINDILDLAKIESGKIDISLEEINLDNIIGECYTLNLPIADKYHVTLDLKDFHSDVYVKADYFRFKQVLINLISNAIKYNKNGGSVSIKLNETNNNTVKIGICDTGMGLSQEQIKSLFQPFQRFSAEKTRIEGTGIGLVIAKNLIEKMHGNITVESVEGDGSIFWVELPLCTGKSVIDKAKYFQPDKIENIDKSMAKNYLILVAEDNPANQEIIKYQLEYLGYRCEIVSNGEDAYDHWLSKDYNMVLMDCNMPGLDGYETTEKIRKNETRGDMHTPIVAFTANALKEDIEKCLHAGMDDYLVKPVDLESLQNKLNKFLAKTNLAMKMEKTDKESSDVTGPVDFSVVKKFIGDNVAAQERVFKKFVDLCPEITSDFNRALADRNAEEVRGNAHKLKSSARALGANALADLCFSLETAAKSADWESIEIMIPKAIAAANEACAAIKSHLHLDH